MSETLVGLFPNPEDLLSLEVEELAGVVLEGYSRTAAARHCVGPVRRRIGISSIRARLFVAISASGEIRDR